MGEYAIGEAELRALKKHLSDSGITVTNIKLGEKSLEIYHSGSPRMSPIKMAYSAVEKLIDALKAETIARITLEMSRGGAQSDVYTMPMNLMLMLQEDFRAGRTTLHQYASKARLMSRDELYSMPLKELEHVEHEVKENWNPGTIVIIPKVTEEDTGDMFRHLNAKQSMDMGLDLLFNLEREDIAKTLGTFSVDKMEIIPYNILEPPELSYLTRRKWEKVVRTASLIRKDENGSLEMVPLNGDTIKEIEEELEEEEEESKVREEF